MNSSFYSWRIHQHFASHTIMLALERGSLIRVSYSPVLNNKDVGFQHRLSLCSSSFLYLLLSSYLLFIYLFIIYLLSSCMSSYLDVEGRHLDTEKPFCLWRSSVQDLPLDVTTPPDYYVWNYRALETLLILSESSADVGFKPLTIGSMH